MRSDTLGGKKMRNKDGPKGGEEASFFLKRKYQKEHLILFFL